MGYDSKPSTRSRAALPAPRVDRPEVRCFVVCVLQPQKQLQRTRTATPA
jgi:hypothetical protein